MKNLIITSILALLVASVTTVRAQDYPEEYLGLPGDNLNLYAVMDLFRNSKTLEDFERGLNDRESRINNLDLNGDNLVDYITVTDYKDGKVHTIVLRAVLGRKDFQDVAVITVEKLRRKKVMIQMIGDPALYGRNYIIEPVYAHRPNPGYYGDPVYPNDATVINNVYYEMYDWPLAVYIYSPHYQGWHSSWYWGYYPAYWNPWRPYYWDYYYGYQLGWYPHYYANYQHSDYYRYRRYNDFYYHGIREQSPQVQHRIAEGNYRQTYSRPEQRSEGEALYSSTHTTRTDETRSNAQVSGQGRREAAPQTTRGQVPAAGTATEKRTKVGADTERRTSTDMATERRVPATVSTRSDNNPAAVNNEGETRRSGAATGNRNEPVPAAVKNTEAPGRSAAIGPNKPAAAAVERSETPSPAPVNRIEVDSKVAEARAAEAREAQTRAAEARAAESRASETRAAEARAAESRAAEARATQAREAQTRAAEARAAESRASETRAAEARAAEARAAENRRTEAAQKSTTSSEKGTARSIKK